MKQKFSILKGETVNQMMIQEYAELDKEILSLLCKETYEEETVQAALAQNDDALIAVLRTRNLYPTRFAVEKISEGVARYFKSGGPVDVHIDDSECLSKKEKACVAVIEDMGEGSTEIDDLLTDDDAIEETYGEEIDIDKINTSIKIADDDAVDIDDDL
ncbi:MAG: hypothetical protein JEZ11_13575 [Desulfobacterales bacterium]|nr:hypothetical protein [Desulfobacterales bacterium]